MRRRKLFTLAAGASGVLLSCFRRPTDFGVRGSRAIRGPFGGRSLIPAFVIWSSCAFGAGCGRASTASKQPAPRAQMQVTSRTSIDSSPESVLATLDAREDFPGAAEVEAAVRRAGLPTPPPPDIWRDMLARSVGRS